MSLAHRPPNSTTCWRASSYAIAGAVLPGGTMAGNFRVQVAPFHTQVSSSRAAAPSEPPNTTTCCLAASYAMACVNLAGGLPAGEFRDQAPPSHTQVSLERPL